MPHYFFHVGDTLGGLDYEGQTLPDDNTARIEAARTMGELLRDKAGEFWSAGEMKLTVTDRTGLVLFVLDLSAIESGAVSRRGQP
jgi:hypothetical protein